MRRYRCWIVGARDATECDLECPAMGVAEAAAKRLGVAVGQVAWGCDKRRPKANKRQYVAVARADYLHGDKLVLASLMQYGTKAKSVASSKMVKATRYRWITDWGERIGEAWDTRALAVGYAVRHKAFSNIKLVVGPDADRIVARQIAVKHALGMTE